MSYRLWHPYRNPMPHEWARVATRISWKQKVRELGKAVVCGKRGDWPAWVGPLAVMAAVAGLLCEAILGMRR